MGGDKRGHGGGGGGKSKRGKYMDNRGKSGAAIPHNTRGFFLSCENGKEAKTAHQMIGALKELHEELCPSKTKEEESKEEVADIQASLASEIAELKEDKGKALFSKLEHQSGKGLCFIKMAWSEEGPTPSELALKLMEDIKSKRERKSRFCMRFVPVEHTCYASKEEISKAADDLVAKHFASGEGVTPLKFSVMFEVRASGPFERMEVIDMVAKKVPAPHTVDLTNPDRTIMVSCVKSVCLLSVITRYNELCKYNCNTLAMTDEEREAMIKASHNQCKNKPAPKIEEAKENSTAVECPAAPDPAPVSETSGVNPVPDEETFIKKDEKAD
mmetsp:Transcript_46034/g.87834  ORF Transcript_46034/g.87834 Transcript_46034/m.87834 type:complete len:329 (-) Transcript_46034:100-1086(-)